MHNIPVLLESEHKNTTLEEISDVVALTFSIYLMHKSIIVLSKAINIISWLMAKTFKTIHHTSIHDTLPPFTV
jgi:hypothetical protein